MSKPGLPIKPTRSSPSRSPKPIRINATVPMQKSIRFFIRILPAFFALVNPVSTIAKPACIQNTRAAPIRNQIPNISASMVSKIVVSIFSSSRFCKIKKRQGDIYGFPINDIFVVSLSISRKPVGFVGHIVTRRFCNVNNFFLQKSHFGKSHIGLFAVSENVCCNSTKKKRLTEPRTQGYNFHIR